MSDLDYGAVFAAMADYVQESCSGVVAYDFMPDRPVCPAFFPGPVEIDATGSFGGLDVAQMQWFFTVDRSGDEQASQRVMTAQLRRTTGTVRSAVISACKSRLGGLVGGAYLHTIDGYREYLFGEVRLYGCRFDIKVTGV